MPHVDISHLTTNGKMIFLAGDHGMENGPQDFNEKSIDPHYLYDIALKNGLNAVVFGRGIAEKYHPDYLGKVPLIMKLNGHSRFNYPDSFGQQNCSVEEAISFGAAAVGYTIHLGGAHESTQLQEFAGIVSAAHANGVPAIAWVYPRGPEIQDVKTPELSAYAARLGLELGADIVNIFNPGNLGALRWCGMAAGRCKVVVSGGDKVSPEEYAEQCHMVREAGLAGVLVGRNVWQAEDPSYVCGLIKGVIYA